MNMRLLYATVLIIVSVSGLKSETWSFILKTSDLTLQPLPLQIMITDPGIKIDAAGIRVYREWRRLQRQ